MGKSLVIKNVSFAANGIPPQFQRLAWIGGTTKDSRDDGAENGQYISSGINMTTNIKLVVEFTLLNESGHGVMLPGSRYSSATTMQVWAQPSAIKVQMAFASGTTENVKTISKSLWDGKKHIAEISKANIKIDGETYSWETTPNNSGQGPAPLYLDCSSYPNNLSEQQYCNSAAYDLVEGTRVPLTGGLKIHNVKIYTDYQNEASLAMDAIPVKRISDNVVCFFNAVTGEYHERNNGSTPEYGTL